MSKDINDIQSEILSACERASRRISLYVGMDLTAVIPTKLELEKIGKQWIGKNHYLNEPPFFDRDEKCDFSLVLKSRSRILAVTTNVIEKSTPTKSLIIDYIKAAPCHRGHLRGKVIAAFSEVNLEVGRAIGSREIAVLAPIVPTRTKYEALGYDVGFYKGGLGTAATLEVTSETVLNWSAFQM